MDKTEFIEIYDNLEKGMKDKIDLDDFTEMLIDNNRKNTENPMDREFIYLTTELGELMTAVGEYKLEPSSQNKIGIMDEIGDALIVIYGFAKKIGLNAEDVEKCLQTKMIRHLKRIGRM